MEKQTTRKVKVSKKVYNASEQVKFIANGKSKHLVAGKVYEMDGAKANLLIAKGYGEVE